MRLLVGYKYADDKVINKIFDGNDHILLVQEAREDECYKDCVEATYMFFEGGEYGDQ
jgi:hypothetical protein